MFSVFRTLSLRYLQRRWFRALLMVASIGLGVATLVATRVLNDTMTRAVLGTTNPLAGVVDFIVSNGELSLPKALAAELRDVPGVKTVQARLIRTATVLLGPDQKRTVVVMGVDLEDVLKQFSDPNKSDDISLSEGTIQKYVKLEALKFIPLYGQLPVVIGKTLADELAPGADSVRVQKDPLDKGQSLGIAGWIQGRGHLAALGGYTLVMDLPNAAKLLNLREDQVHRIDIALKPGVDPTGIRKEIEKRLGDRARISTPEEHNQAKGSAISGMQTGFALCGLAALVVGVFLVYNSLAVGVQERRHEIGLLLALGATRAQVLRLFALEAGILGLAGSLLGIPMGLLLAHLGMPSIQDIMRDIFGTMQAERMELSWGLAGLALAAGMGTAMFAALVPAVQASRENPAEAVRRIAKGVPMRRLVTQAIVSLAMVAAGGLLILCRDNVPHRLGTYGGLVLVLVGALVASPFFAALAARLMQPFIRRFASVEWRLAADNLVRSPGRTGLVIGALAAGVSLVVQTAGTIRSNRLALREWIENTIHSDLLVTSGGPISVGQTVEMDESLGQELRKVPGVVEALPTRQMFGVRYHDTTICLIALEVGPMLDLEKHRGESSTRPLYQSLEATTNGVLVSENFAALHGVRKGDTIQVGGVALTVLGEVVDYTWNHGTLILNRRDYKKHWKDHQVSVYEIYLQDGSNAERAKEAINRRLGAQFQLHAMTRTELQAHVDTAIERLYGIAYGQQIVVMLVAALGVVTALLISVMQRRREMGLLRAIGASRGQVIHSVLAEASLMGVIGTAIGLCVGIPLQWYVLHVLILEESGYLFPMYIPWEGALIIAVAATATAILAGLGPALHSVRQRIPEAIAYE